MHLQGTKSGGLFGKKHGGDYARRAAGTLLIHFTMPFDELLGEILLIVEAAHFEEGGLYETHEVFDGTFLPRTMRPTQLTPTPSSSMTQADQIPFRRFSALTTP